MNIGNKESFHSTTQMEKAKLLLKKGDVDIKDKDRNTLLHLAADSNNIEVVKYLIENGADIEAKDESGKTPLYIASDPTHGHTETLKCLIEKGADIEAKDESDRTPLNFALAMHPNPEIAELLIKNGAKS